MEPRGEIIAFRQFENSIDANIAKTKLDAYGIPCFLTEENLANLYPGQYFMGFAARLHLFAADGERAGQILNERNLTNNDLSTQCPNCLSNKVDRDFPRKTNQRLSHVLGLLFFGIFFPKHKVYHCLECKHEF